MNLEDRVFVRFKGRTVGPMSPADAKNLVRRGQITPTHEVSGDGVSWRSAKEFSELFPSSTRAAEPAKATVNSQQLELQPEAQAQIKVKQAETVVQPIAVWYAHIDGANQGPMEESQFKQLISIGRITKDTLVWREGMADWQAAELVMGSAFGSRSKSNRRAAESGSSSDFVTQVAQEYCRARGWAMFLGIVFIVSSVIQFIGMIFSIVVALGANNAYILLSQMLLIVPALITLQMGLLKIGFSNALNTLQIRPTESNLILATRASLKYWRFYGFVMAVSLIVATVALLVIMLLVSFAGGAATRF